MEILFLKSCLSVNKIEKINFMPLNFGFLFVLFVVKALMFETSKELKSHNHWQKNTIFMAFCNKFRDQIHINHMLMDFFGKKIIEFNTEN